MEHLLLITILMFPLFAAACIGVLVWDRTKTREWLLELQTQAFNPLVTTIDYIIHRDGEEAARAALARAKGSVDLQILQETLRQNQAKSGEVVQTPTSPDSFVTSDGRILELVTPDNMFD